MDVFSGRKARCLRCEYKRVKICGTHDVRSTRRDDTPHGVTYGRAVHRAAARRGAAPVWRGTA